MFFYIKFLFSNYFVPESLLSLTLSFKENQPKVPKQPHSLSSLLYSHSYVSKIMTQRVEKLSRHRKVKCHKLRRVYHRFGQWREPMLGRKEKQFQRHPGMYLDDFIPQKTCIVNWRRYSISPLSTPSSPNITRNAEDHLSILLSSLSCN